MSSKARIKQPEMSLAILGLMKDGLVWTNGRLKARLGDILELSAEDRQRANERGNEPKFHSIVNNCLSESRNPYLIKNGLVVNVAREEYRITEKGKAVLGCDGQTLKDKVLSYELNQPFDW